MFLFSLPLILPLCFLFYLLLIHLLLYVHFGYTEVLTWNCTLSIYDWEVSKCWDRGRVPNSDDHGNIIILRS